MNAVPKSRILVFVLLAIVGCAIDLTTKSWIFAWRGMPFYSEPWWLIDEVFGFNTNLNEGALGGIGDGYSLLFAALSVAAGAAIVYFLFVVGVARQWLLTIALGLVMGGILGNLYDRLGLHGLTWGPGYKRHAFADRVYAVRDWIDFKIDGWLHWPTFNIADSLLVAGAGLLIFHAFFPNTARAPNSVVAAGDRTPTPTALKDSAKLAEKPAQR